MAVGFVGDLTVLDSFLFNVSGWINPGNVTAPICPIRLQPYRPPMMFSGTPFAHVWICTGERCALTFADVGRYYMIPGCWPCGFAVSSMPSAFITAMVVFRVGLPFSLNER